MDADRRDVEAKTLRRNRAALSILGVLLLISGLSSIAIGRLNYPNWRGAGLVLRRSWFWGAFFFWLWPFSNPTHLITWVPSVPG
jgi:hypothetical protein